VAIAAVQVVKVGTADQVVQAHKILTNARRGLYAILAAEDEPGEDEPGTEE